MRTRSFTVLPHDPAWADAFEAICAQLRPAIGSYISDIAHVGSTAVPDLWAKPILDIDLVLPDADALPAVIAGLAPLGYAYEGDLGIPGRYAFAYDPAAMPGIMEHHLYACPADSPELHRHLTFRNHLRQHKAARDTYSKVKQEAAALYPGDIDRYIAHKSPCIQALYAECGLISNKILLQDGPVCDTL